MTLLTIIIGYIGIGMLIQTAMLIKDMILRYAFKMDALTIERTGLKIQLFLRIGEVLIWPLEILFTLRMIFAKMTNDTKFFESINRGLDQIDEANKGD